MTFPLPEFKNGLRRQPNGTPTFSQALAGDVVRLPARHPLCFGLARAKHPTATVNEVKARTNGRFAVLSITDPMTGKPFEAWEGDLEIVQQYSPVRQALASGRA